MEKIWLKEYPDRVSAEIDINTYTSFVEILEKSLAQHGHLIAFECMGARLSFAQLDTLTKNFASYLTVTLGLVKGDRVAIMLPNLLQYPVAMFGIMRAGLVAVNVNPLYTARELEYQLQDSGARAIVLLDALCQAHHPVLARAGLKAVITTPMAGLGIFPESLDDMAPMEAASADATTGLNVIELRTALAKGSQLPFTRVVLTHADNALLQYTGGTTGLSKGAQLTQGNITANVLQVGPWMLDPSNGTEECFITMLPLYHIMALTACCLVSVSLGSKNVLFPNPRDMEGNIAELRKHRFTVMLGVNTLFTGLLNTPAFAELDFSALKLTIGAGAAVQQLVAERWKKLTGNDLSEAYGLTETSPGATFSPTFKWDGTIGVPLPSTIVSLRDDDNREVSLGSPGELCIKGPQVMRGYWNKPKETADAFTPDGYFKTGDIGIMNERGYFKLVDRKKDMILVSGFNVYPTEIEAVVSLHEGVLECACVGVPDEKSGEVPKVYIVRKDPGLDIKAIEGHCRMHLAGYKLPKHFEFRDALPKSNVGKILRRALRPA